MMNDDQQEIYNEGFNDYHRGQDEDCNPYCGLNAEFWGDGWCDACEDDNQ
jgi:hypothetical protein